MTETPTKPETKTKRILTVEIEYDQDLECPIGESGDTKERFVSFNRRHKAYADPSEWIAGLNRHGEVIFTPEGFGLRRQLETGTAFILSYFEHGSSVWSLQGAGPQCQWDTADVAGIYWLPSDVPKDRRREYAKAAMESYTDWCNGNGYGYTITDQATGEMLDSCWGFIGDKHASDSILEAIQNVAGGSDFEVIWAGDAKGLAEYGKLGRLTEYEDPEDDD